MKLNITLTFVVKDNLITDEKVSQFKNLLYDEISRKKEYLPNLLDNVFDNDPILENVKFAVEY